MKLLSITMYYDNSLESLKRNKSIEEVSDVQKKTQIQNIPFEHWHRLKEEGKSQDGDGCQKYPNIFELHYNNKYWQVMRGENVTIYIFSAHLDQR